MIIWASWVAASGTARRNKLARLRRPGGGLWPVTAGSGIGEIELASMRFV